MTIADKAAEIKSALGDDGEEFGPEDVLEEALERRLRRRAALRAAFKPKADIFEHAGMLVIKAVLPGVKKGDVEVTMDDGDLVISGERKAEPAIKDEDYYQGETMYGRFYRRLPLPAGVKLEQIKAAHQDGVLEIRVPMPERPKVALT
jgi:HSP20 family protein